MSGQKTNAKLQAALEWGPLLAFFAGFMLLKADHYSLFGHDVKPVILMTAVLVPLTILSAIALYILNGELSRMQIFSTLLIVGLGTASVFLNDDRFIKMKPTALYLAFAGILGVGLLQGKSYLAYLMGELLPVDEAGWMKLTKRMALFFLVLAIANEIVWRNLSTSVWVSVKIFGFTTATFIFMASQFMMLSKHMLPDGTDKDKDKDKEKAGD